MNTHDPLSIVDEINSVVEIGRFFNRIERQIMEEMEQTKAVGDLAMIRCLMEQQFTRLDQFAQDWLSGQGKSLTAMTD